MQSLWNDEEARRFGGALGARVYTSRLLGRDRSLVLHGGGNTSVKLRETDLFGDVTDVLYVKGSGWDLETIEAEGFTPVELTHLRRLALLPSLPDTQMVNELNTHRLRDGAPSPSVESILHAVLPARYVDHTHADAVLSISNAPDGERRIRELYGDSVIVIPYVMAGFDLARRCAQAIDAGYRDDTAGIVLLSHGVITFGDDARTSYERMIALVSTAEEYLRGRRAWQIALPSPRPATAGPDDLASLRRAVSDAAGAPMLMRVSDDERLYAFAHDPQLGRISQQGPATPDHVIRTKPWPMLGTDVAGYAERYHAYFERHAPHARDSKTMLDGAPRMALDPRFGFASFARSARDLHVIEELYAHTIDVILRAEALGGWNAVTERDLFDIEYWDLEQAKLRRGGKPATFAGEVALVTGAASGIGAACVEAFLARGAAVVGLDRSPAIETQAGSPARLGVHADVTDRDAVQAAIARAVNCFGGIDMLVLNAGIFTPTTPVERIDPKAWRTAMRVNVEANLFLLQACFDVLRHAPRAGRVVVIGSKNVPAPGPGAAAYSASKAALNQLARVTAIEWAAHGIRVNVLHPNAVYDTAIWTDEVLAARAAAYGLSVEDYRRNNLLRTEVRSRDVAELAAEMCGPLFAKTTGAQLPVDGGNDRVV